MPDHASKTCSRCGQVKALSEFNAHPRTRDRRQSQCRECSNKECRERHQQRRAEELERMRASYLANRQARIEQARDYRQANRDEISQRRRQNYEANREAQLEQNQRAYRTHREARVLYARAKRAQLRAQVFAHYGTACACCGTPEDLSIDHIAGGGAQHRQELFGHSRRGGADRFYVWLIKHGFPAGYQTLCMPCNASKRDGERCCLNHGE